MVGAAATPTAGALAHTSPPSWLCAILRTSMFWILPNSAGSAPEIELSEKSIQLRALGGGLRVEGSGSALRDVSCWVRVRVGQGEGEGEGEGRAGEGSGRAVARLGPHRGAAGRAPRDGGLPTPMRCSFPRRINEHPEVAVPRAGRGAREVGQLADARPVGDGAGHVVLAQRERGDAAERARRAVA
eukprot:734153-Prymnesium_polylepis.1